MSSRQWYFMGLVLWSLLVCVSGNAGGEGSGGTIIKKIRTSQEYMANLYEKMSQGKNLPQMLTNYVSRFELCQEGHWVRTARPKNICASWKVPVRESSSYETFADYLEAKKFAIDQGRGAPFCEDQDFIPTIFAIALEQNNTSSSYYIKNDEYVVAPCKEDLLHASGVIWVIYGDENVM